MAEHVDDELKQAAKAAAATAAVGAAVGIARAIAERAGHSEPEDEHEEQPEEQQAIVDEHDDPENPAPQPERRPQPQPQRGEAVDRLRRLTDTARSLLEELSGTEVEAVSAVDRVDGGWRVTLEALELRRVPDSTDVLATYDVELDSDGDLVRYERRRRYARSQSDGGNGR